MPAGEPTTAEEYLKRVRYEASRCQQIVRSNIDPEAFAGRQTAYFREPDSILDAPKWAKPTTAWVRQFVQVSGRRTRQQHQSSAIQHGWLRNEILTVLYGYWKGSGVVEHCVSNLRFQKCSTAICESSLMALLIMRLSG